MATTSELRRGWTTGACATAAAKSAFHALVGGRFLDPVAIRLPGGEAPSFPLAHAELASGRATAGVVKDAGDDPDVTHGALVLATVEAAPPGSGVGFRAGEGVGTVTLAGLPLAVGEPAINDGPRAMMRAEIAAAAAALGAPGDVTITIAIPGGEALAARTANGRLGIKGGLSVLGTTGIVVPYSCSAWIASIQRGVDVARAAGCRHIAGATGRVSEAAVQRKYSLPDPALIEMGDFAGALLKYLRRHPVERLTIAGGFAKLAKLAQGALDLHSDRSKLDLARLADALAGLGADAATVAAARAAKSGGAVLALANGFPLASRIAAGARATSRAILPGAIGVEVIVIDRAGNEIGHAGP